MKPIKATMKPCKGWAVLYSIHADMFRFGKHGTPAALHLTMTSAQRKLFRLQGNPVVRVEIREVPHG